MRIYARLSDGRKSAENLLDATEAMVRQRLGDAVFGIDSETLASAVGRQLVCDSSAALSIALPPRMTRRTLAFGQNRPRPREN